MEEEYALQFIFLGFNKSFNGLSFRLRERIRSSVSLRAWIIWATSYHSTIKLPVIVPIEIDPTGFFIDTWHHLFIFFVHVLALIVEYSGLYVLFRDPPVSILVYYRYIEYLMFLEKLNSPCVSMKPVLHYPQYHIQRHLDGTQFSRMVWACNKQGLTWAFRIGT